VVHKFTGGPSGFTQNEASHINKDSLLLSIFLLFFLEIMQVLEEETNRHYHQKLATTHEECPPLPDMTILEIYLMLSIIVQMDHNKKTD
jgi:hypothetical protein